MRILITVNAAWNIWNFRQGLVRDLIAQGHAVTVLAPPDNSVSDLEAIGCNFEPLNMSVKGLNPFHDIKLIGKFVSIFRKERPDVVLSYTIKNNVFGAIAARIAKVEFIPNVTGLGTAFLSGGLLSMLAKVLYRAAFSKLKVVFFQNEDDQALFTKLKLVKLEQARLLPGSGINLKAFEATQYPAQGAPFIFLMISRLIRDKGVLEFVEAARAVKLTHPEARFQILGPTGSENRTAISSEQVKGWVDEGLIEYLGQRSDVRPFIAQASCVVLPSYREGAPRTLIEAAAMARPLITTNVPGCRSIVDDTVSGYLCKVKSQQSLADAMDRLLKLPRNERDAMGRAGRVKMEREFDEAIIVEAYKKAMT